MKMELKAELEQFVRISFENACMMRRASSCKYLYIQCAAYGVCMNSSHLTW